MNKTQLQVAQIINKLHKTDLADQATVGDFFVLACEAFSTDPKFDMPAFVFECTTPRV